MRILRVIYKHLFRLSRKLFPSAVVTAKFEFVVGGTTLYSVTLPANELSRGVFTVFVNNMVVTNHPYIIEGGEFVVLQVDGLEKNARATTKRSVSNVTLAQK